MSAAHGKGVNQGNDITFQWGKKRGVGGAKKDVQFYESFTYDGIEYFLYDCVYLYNEEEPEPYIGKLVKIFGKKQDKKIKVVWFFRPIEIANWFDGSKALENELFLASGDGYGVCNLNPLEVIIGKCNVVCISKDKGNLQPSDENLKMADFVFYRTFDVKNFKVSENIDNTIAGVDVGYFFNRDIDLKHASVPKIETGVMVPNGRTSTQDVHHVANQAIKLEETNTLKNEKKALSIQKATKMNNADLVKLKSTRDEVCINQSIDKQKSKASSPSNAVEDRPVKRVRLSENVLNSAKGFLGVEGSKDRTDASVSIVRDSENATKMRDRFLSDQDKRVSKENLDRPSDGIKAASKVVHDRGSTADQSKDIAKRPHVDKAKWFKALPWEDQLQTAYQNEKLLFFENLPLWYTSAEVQDIILDGFQVSCTAKLVQTKYPIRHDGQAFVIFRSKDAAHAVLQKVSNGCLMLPNGRPLVCSRKPPKEFGKPSNFLGHLAIDSIKRQMQREEVKNAVSTSHCSQQNTIEFEMASDWKLLQKKYEERWKELFKQQEEEVRKLGSSLKTW